MSPTQFIVALRAGADSEAARAAIVAAGGTPSSHLPEAAVLAILPGGGGAPSSSASARLSAHPAIAWAAPFAPPYKVAPEWTGVLEWVASLLPLESGGAGAAGDGDGVADGSEVARAARAAAPAARPPPPGKAASPYLRPPAPPRLGESSTGTATTTTSSNASAAAWTVEILVTFPTLGPFPGAAASLPVPPPPYAPAAAAAAAWAPALASICAPATCTLTPADSLLSSRLAITAPAARAPALVPWLAASPATHWVSPRARARPRNFFAAGICQAGAPGRVDVATGMAWATAPTTGSHTPHWAAGLRGGGQILGLGDTGLDADHCLFSDPAVPGPGAAGGVAPKVGPDGVRAWESATHRKLR